MHTVNTLFIRKERKNEHFRRRTHEKGENTLRARVDAICEIRKESLSAHSERTQDSPRIAGRVRLE